jgi:hypothetical protein
MLTNAKSSNAGNHIGEQMGDLSARYESTRVSVGVKYEL